jgi:hypothetical protein
VNNHLKGRIVSVDGMSYLILQEKGEASEWVRVKSVDAKRRIVEMRASVIEGLLPAYSTGAPAPAGNP